MAIFENFLILYADGKVKRYHALKTEHGFDQLLSLATFNDPCNGYIVDDCCAFGVEVHVIKRTGKGEEISFIRNPRNGTYTWRLKKFSTLSLSCYYSEIFVAANYKWYVPYILLPWLLKF